MPRPVDIAYDYLKERILDGRLAPSQKLTETQLAEEIGVSRNTVIKALLKLEQENLVTIEKNKGATITSFTLPEILNYLDIRRVLEGLAIRSAVEHINDESIDELQTIVQQMESKLSNNRFDEYSKLNKKFHQILYDASANKQAVDMILKIKTQLNRLHLKTILMPGRKDESHEEHKAIFAAVKKRDPDAAEAAIMQHVNRIRDVVAKHYTYLI
ncbi:GntR family transcriptional regulator [Cohnella laeviribosi]|uniref:GntR family transcriptional regulator n=1 Tax=Cohnella laeviribosi TaxID=380174 RepID=UPI00036F8188|nr:GntR family transcriptional regulator [Cohnella laeviribosi]